jgi:transposase-like protein
MYLNNCGIRKTALFIGCSRTTVMNWVRDAKHQLDEILKDYEPNYSDQPDIIEFDEIYTYVKKNKCGSSFGLLILGTQSVLLRL